MENEIEVKPGQYWQERAIVNEDPFKRKMVEILEVREGFVLVMPQTIKALFEGESESFKVSRLVSDYKKIEVPELPKEPKTFWQKFKEWWNDSD